MKLELNLVETPNVLGGLANVKDRTRVLVDEEDHGSVVTACFNYLASHISTLQLSGISAETIQLIQNPGDATKVDLMSTKYLLGLVGLDLLIYAVDEAYVTNQLGVPSEEVEYLIVDSKDVVAGFVPRVSRIVDRSDNLSRAGIYKTIIDQYDLFPEDKFGKDNILRPNVENLINQESLSGKMSTGLTTYVDLLLNYLGLNLVLLLPSDDVI